MGILFVLILWGIIGSIVAIIGALVLRTIASALAGKEQNDPDGAVRQHVIRFATLLPFACLVWAGLIFVFQAFINSEYLHRDVGLGDEMYCPLPNGYSISMIDDGEEGTVYSAKAAFSNGAGSDVADGMSGVRDLQIAGLYILGAADSRYVEHFAQDNPTTDRYFIIDTRTGRRTDFSSEDELRLTASRSGIKLKLEPIFDVYRQYRFTWFDYVASFLLIAPPVIALGLLLKLIMRLRRIVAAASVIGGLGSAT